MSCFGQRRNPTASMPTGSSFDENLHRCRWIPPSVPSLHLMYVGVPESVRGVEAGLHTRRFWCRLFFFRLHLAELGDGSLGLYCYGHVCCFWELGWMLVSCLSVWKWGKLGVIAWGSEKWGHVIFFLYDTHQLSYELLSVCLVYRWPCIACTHEKSDGGCLFQVWKKERKKERAFIMYLTSILSCSFGLRTQDWGLKVEDYIDWWRYVLTRYDASWRIFFLYIHTLYVVLILYLIH